MFANRFTATLDACVLAPALTRNLLLSLAEAELYRPMFSDLILDEVEQAITKMLKAKGAPDLIKRARDARDGIAHAFPEAFTTVRQLSLDAVPDMPDYGDRHVVLTALNSESTIIVTDNLKDFPLALLITLGLEVRSPDEFISDTLMLPNDSEAAVLSIKRMRARFANPAFTANELLARMETVGLTSTAAILSDRRALW